MRMIFYHPVPIKEEGSSNRASQLRPAKMLAAFKNIGVIVDEVNGYGRERNRSIQSIKSNVENGMKYDFAYGENTTLPFALNERDHIPRCPFLDYSFFAWLKRENIPFGCFYRDVYWKFPEFRKDVTFFKWAVPLPFHYLDFYMLKKYSSVIFLPSLEMKEYLPFNSVKNNYAALPPGCEISERLAASNSRQPGKTINFFYVGGVTPPNYDMTPMFSFFSQPRQNLTFTLACRKEEWDALSEASFLQDHDQVILLHKTSNELSSHWGKASIFLALWGNVAYHNFAMPYKIFEAIGRCLPIITTSGTAAGAFVEKHGFGWAIEPKPSALENLVEQILTFPEMLREKRHKILCEQNKHTWEARAEEALSIITRRD